MELELGLKITKTRDDIDSISEYQFMKDTGPVFKSRETNTMFILTAHLKGFKRNNIDINISKDGNKISIRGNKPIQEMVMMGWVMQRKVVDVKGFNKVFKIPYGVNLDKIKANYNEEEWMLNIVMPKLVKGILGLKIEETKEQEFDKGRTKQGTNDFDNVSSSVGETSQKETKESEFQHMEGSENIINEKMIYDTKKEINEEIIQKEVGEYKLRIEDRNGESVREKGGKQEYEVSKKLEIDQSVGAFISKEIEDKSQDKEFEDQKLNSRSVDDVNRDLIGSIIKEDKEESKLRIKDSMVKDTSQLVFEESIIQQSGESKQKEFEEQKVRFEESIKENSKEPFEAMKLPKLDENVVDHIPNNIDCINQTQLKEQYEKPPFEVYEDVQKTMFGDTIQKEIIKPNKEGFDAKIINEEFPKMQETKNEKEEMVSKEVEYFAEKGEGERLKMMHVEAKKGNNTTQTFEKEIEESDNEIKENDKQKVDKIEGSSGINDAKKDEQNVVMIMKESLVEKESLIVEGDESKERTNEKFQDGEDKIENSIVKLKGEGSTKMHVEVNEPFEGENVNNGIFDGRDTKMFHEIEQTKDVNEKGENVEHSLMKVNSDKYEKIQNEENEGLNVQKELEIKDVIENVVKRNGKEIEYFVEKGEDDRLKSMHVKAMKGNNAIETMQDEIEKSEHGIKESGKEHANENTIKEELPRQVAEIDETKEFIVAKEEEKYKVLSEGLVESESLVEMVQGEESNQMTKAIVRDDEDKIEYSIEKFKENGHAKIHFEPNDHFEKIEKEIRNQNLEPINELSEKENANIGIFDGRKANKFQEINQTEHVKEKNAKVGNFAKIVNEKIQNEEDEDLKKNTTKEKDECCFQEEMSEEICQETMSGKEDFSMKMLDSQIDSRERPKDRKMEKTKGIKEESSKVEKEKYEKMQVEENDGLRNEITKRKQNESEKTKLVTKIKDQQSSQKEKSKRRDGASTMERELPMKSIDSLAKSREGPKDKKIDEKKIVESTTKEELQWFEIETTSKVLFEENEENNSKAKEIGTPKRTFQSIASTGFREFDYGNAKDKKQKKKLKKEETHESKDESINQDILNQKKTKDGGEQCGYNNVSAKEVGTIDDEVVKSLSTPKFQISQSEVEEKDKLSEGGKANYKGSIESEMQNHTKDIQNFIEMKENEEVEQNDTLKQELRLEKELKKEEKDEFLNGETMREKIDEPKNKYKNQNANDENFKIHGEISKDGIENEKCFHEEMKTKRPLELEKTIVQWKFPKTKDQHDYGTEEMKFPKIAASQEAKPSKLQRSVNNQQSTEKIKAIEEHESTKDSPKLSIVETATIESLQPQFLDGQENVLQKKEKPKVAKIEDKLASKVQRNIIKTTQTTEEKELKMKEITTPFEKASGSKRVEEKVHDTPDRELQREIQEVTSKMGESYTTGERKDPQELTRPNMECEISKVKEVGKENEVESHIHVLEETIFKEEGTNANEVESLEASLNNDSVQHESRPEEIKQPKNATYQEVKTPKLQSSRIKQQFKDEINRKSEENIDSLPPHLLDEQEVLHVQEKNDKKGFHTPDIVEEERVVTKTEGPMVAKNEETKRVSRKSKSKEQNKPKLKELTTQFEKASGSKSVEEKVHETPKREHQRELEKVTSKIEVKEQTTVEKTPIKGVEMKEPLELTSPPNLVNEILNEEEKCEEKEGQKNIQVLEETIAKGKEDRGHQYVQEKNNKKGFQTQKTIEEEEVLKKMEVAKIAKSEETKDDHTFKRQDEKTTQASKFDEASSGSKRVGEKVHETSDRNHQRELEEVISKMDNEIPKVKEFRKEEVERHIQELEANISKEKDRVEQKEDTSSQLNSTVPKNSPTKKHFHTAEDTPTLELVADKVVQQLEVPSTSCTQQFKFEGEEKAKERESKIDVDESKKCKRGQEIEQCINNDEEAMHGIEEIKEEEKDNEQVFEGQKEDEDETRGGKKNKAKISKEFFVPLVIAGSALIVTLIATFVRQRRARKM
ncbi:centromere-associated protein E [Trifolium repens]|nr:centromere-associated protein E [Trifolium repens]